MNRGGIFIRYWLPVIIWAGLIFSASSDSGSAQHTSRFLGPLFHWLFPSMSDKTVEDMVFSVRKCAHVTEYAVLSLLVWRALRRPVRGDARGWDWRSARLAFVTAVLYAGTDEFHQLFVRGREARVHDVGIDACGAGAALAVLWLLGRWRREW